MRTTIFSSFFLSCFITATAIAGGVGNGGGSHYCPGRTYQELYDLYEGKVRYGLEFETALSNKPVSQYLKEAVKKVRLANISLAREIEKQLDYLDRAENFVLIQDLDLVPIPDANILMKNKGCVYRQVANWDDATGKVFVDEDTFKTFPSLHKAALKFHEALYSYGREKFKHKDSDRTRRLTAEVFSKTLKMETIADFTLPHDIVSTDTMRPHQFEVQEENGHVKGGVSLALEDLSELDRYSIIYRVSSNTVEKVQAEISALNAQVSQVEEEMRTARKKEKRDLQSKLNDLKTQANEAKTYLKEIYLDELRSNGFVEDVFTSQETVRAEYDLALGVEKWKLKNWPWTFLSSKPLDLELDLILLKDGVQVASFNKKLEPRIKTTSTSDVDRSVLGTAMDIQVRVVWTR